MDINNINEAMTEAVEKVGEEAEVVKNAAEEAFECVASMDGSTIIKIGVVGGLVGAAASAFVFRPIAKKVAAIPQKVKQSIEDSKAKANESKRKMTQAAIDKLQKKLDETEESKE